MRSIGQSVQKLLSGNRDRHTDRHTDRQTDRHTHTDICKTFTYPLSRAVNISSKEDQRHAILKEKILLLPSFLTGAAGSDEVP